MCVCVCACVRVCMRVQGKTQSHVCEHACDCVSMNRSVCVPLYMSVYAHAYVCVDVDIYKKQY